MSSSRSIAAARSRRAGESQPPVSGGRPGTSIASHSAFVPQQMQPPPNNVRVAKAPTNQQQQQQMQQQSNGMPFSKLSISDAIGLITLRLGRVEQFVIDYENGEISTGPQSEANIPNNSKIIDNSVLANIINRLDALEKKDSSTSSSSVSNEQISKIEKDLKETKDLLAHMLFKFELFTKETNDKFTDFEGAISEIEKNMETPQFTEINDTVSANINIIDTINEDANVQFNDLDLKNIAVDLKNLVKQELANSEQNN
jgi:hypothetical protein